MQISKRQLLTWSGMAAIGLTFGCGKDATAKARYAVTYSDAEWKKRLSPAAYRVLRQEDTETPYTSPLNKEKRRGTFSCAGCAQRLFSSTTKFESGTGWPSFYQPLAGGVATTTDYKIGMARTEVHCTRHGQTLLHERRSDEIRRSLISSAFSRPRR
jgi:peptide-methionine (R)-S-oxide reductase